jgi:hypothetical protein
VDKSGGARYSGWFPVTQRSVPACPGRPAAGESRTDHRADRELSEWSASEAGSQAKKAKHDPVRVMVIASPFADARRCRETRQTSIQNSSTPEVTDYRDECLNS